MRRPLEIVLPAALAVSLFVAPSRGDDDPAHAGTDAKLAALDGKFREADGIIERAPPEVQNDPAVHLAIADLAMKFTVGKTGEDTREALFSARQHFAKVVELTPADPKAATGVVTTAQKLGDLDVAARKIDDAKAEATFAITAAEKSVAAGVAAPEFKAALGRMYGFRCSFLKSMKDVDQLDGDSIKAAKLLTEAAAVDKEGAFLLLSQASAIRRRVADLIHENIPVASEKRDDEALYGAIVLATMACKQAGATNEDYLAHLDALLLAHKWGVKSTQGPFLQPVTPPLGDLKLQQPRASGWVHEKVSADWDIVLTRNLHDEKNDGSVQLMLKEWTGKQTSLGKTWNKLAEIAPLRFEKYKGDLEEVSSSVAPAQIAVGKNAPEIWCYQVTGKQKSGRTSHIAEWIWADKKKDVYWQMKIIDWRPVPDIEEPDLVAFVGSAIGDGIWPPSTDAKKPPSKNPPEKK